MLPPGTRLGPYEITDRLSVAARITDVLNWPATVKP